MLQPRRTVLLTIVILSTCGLLLRNVDCKTEVNDDSLDNEDDLHLHKPSEVDRVKRDAGDVTTVLLVDNTGRHRDGRFNKKAVGLLTSTARTFVQEGTTTEFATQVVGTTLDNGRLYAQVVTTSSRVFYNGDSGGRDKTRTKLDELVLPSIADIARPTEPIQVLPSRTDDSAIQVEPFSYAKSGNIYQTAVNEQHAPRSRYIGEPSISSQEPSEESHEPPDEAIRDELEALFLQAKARKQNRYFTQKKEDEGEVSENFVKSKRMDYFKRKNQVDGDNQDSGKNDVKPARVVRPLDGLPTFTIRHDFAPSGFSFDDNYEDSTESRTETSLKGSRFRSGKAFFKNRAEQRKLDTVTYLGFSDFTTTVGDTVIIFMPHTPAHDAHQGRKATSISGDATLAPELQHSASERTVSVVTSVKTFMSHTPGMVTRTITGHSLSMQTALPTMVVLPETSSASFSPQSVTIRRDKALSSAQVVEPVTEHPPTDFDDVAQYLAHEQSEMADKALTRTPEESVTEPLPDSEIIHPSSVSYNENVQSSIGTVIEPSPIETSTEDLGSSTATDSLGYFSTARTQTFDNGGAEFPLGLIKVIGGTEALNGTTTLFTSLIYGTTIDGNYAQIIHSTSSIFFYIDDTKVDMKIHPTSVLDSSSSTTTTMSTPSITTDQEQTDGTTLPPTTLSDSTKEQPEITTDNNSITTFEQSTTEEDNKQTTVLDETLTTVPLEETTTEPNSDSINEVETGRKISSNPNDQVIIDFGDGKSSTLSPTSSSLLTQLIPSTVYKTFTYLTTFFIPAEGTSTTTSIRSREVTSSEINYVTRIFDPNIQSSMESPTVVTTGSVEISSSIAISPSSSVQEERLQTTTPDGNTVGTTNQDEVTEQTTMTTPELPEEKTTVAPEENQITTTPSKTTIEGEEEEIELIFKTLYTTYTYLTTFFEESTTSVSSREVVVTNVVTSTVDRSYILTASDPAVAGLFGRDDGSVSSSSPEIAPTSVGIGRPTTKYYPDLGINPDEDLFSSVIESVDLEKELATPTPVLNNLASDDNELKTFYTTYTYFTTILVDGETEVESRTEIYTNIITPSGLLLNPSSTKIEPTISLREPLFENAEPSVLDQLESPHSRSYNIDYLESSQIRTPSLKSTPLYSYSSTINRSQRPSSEGIVVSNLPAPSVSSVNSADVDDEENSIFPKITQRVASSYATITRSRNIESSPVALAEETTSKSPIASREVENIKSLSPVFIASSSVSDRPAVVETMSTDVTSSSSDGGRVMMLEKRNDKQPLLDDQISSESNTEVLEPSPTLLLQTSFTTFTYFTTVYKGSSSDVISRLETITNIVTETLSPSAVPTISIPPEEATLPITYFTTFTYWTTLYRGSSTIVTSREETVSNVVTPSISPSTSIVLPLEITPSPTPTAVIVTPVTSTIPEPTTFYTTYTYFTTSYIGNSTVLSSRLETVTNIVNGSTSDATGRAVGSGATEQKIPTETVKPESSNKLSTAIQPTGLLSTILTSQVNDGTTTLFSTDVYGTFIDGLYAQVLESSTQIVTAPLVSPTKANPDLKPTGVVSLNEGKIIDAQGVSTTFFTTKAVGTYIDALYAEVVESTTSIYVNPERKSVLQQISPSNVEGVKTPKTGLVRIVEGSIIKDHTTTYYESKVIGTLIDGRYAQIIESTSSFKVEVSHTSVPGSAVNEIAPTSTLSPGISVTPTSSSTTSPTPAVIESSLNEGGNRDEDDENDEDDSDEGDGKKNKKSRLTFTSRKRTFTPVIRPFSSRNRPTFNPRRKTAIGSSATTITRTTVTPTVTATPAAKTEAGGRGRFNNNRRGSSSGVYKTNYNDIRATPSGAGGRRPSRTRGSSVGVTSSSTHYTGRGRSSSGSTRLYASSVPGQTGVSRRGSFFRSSTGRPGSSESYRGSSSGVHHATASSSRFRIRPTSSILGRGSTAYTTPSSDETLVPDDDLTTLITEETPHFTDDQQDAQTQPISTTTESPRRSNNPLLRFRRPPIPRSQSTTTTTPKPTTTQSSRRSPLLRRPASERGSTTPRSRTSTRYNPVLSRQRTTNNLFPPRGLLKKPGKEDEDEEAKKEGEDELQDEEHQEEGGEEHEEDEEFGDNDYEGSETSESKTKPNKSANRRSSKVYNPVQIKPFVGFSRKRTKRETEYGVRSAGGSTRSYTPRYRRPSSGTTRTVHESDEDLDTYEESSKPKVTPNTARFTPRPRNSAVTPSRIRPTSASSNTGRSQFTLRKDDTTSSNNRANFRRPTTPSPRRRTNNRPPEPASTAQRPKPPRLRTQTNSRATEATTYSRSNSRSRNTNTNRRGSGRTRSRGETSDYYDTYTYSQSSFDGTITVTHHIPTEVTIPVVNGKVTEYRNVITASPSTEVLGPHQYTVSTANNGITMIYLTSELVGTLPGGATEITQFVVHETPTTSVTFTPTVIRGHKTSYSHIIPSTVYDVEQVVSTVQPQISPNSPLANILLSQLLLGNLGLQPNLNPILALNNPATPGTPTTEYKTRQTTYVTTVTKGMSTVIPLTFRGKEILTTIIDSSTEVITATEFLTDTIVVTPTAGNNQLNSLLLPALLQAQLLQPQPQPMIQNPLLAGLQQQLLQQEHKPAQEPLFEDILSDRSSKHRHRLAEEADRLVRDSDKEILDDDTVQNFKNEEAIKDRSFKTARRKSKIEKKPPDPPPVPSQPETSIVTLYVSGRRPGEFSTVISTVTLGQESSATIKKREAGFVEAEMYTVSASNVPEIGGSFPTSDDDGGYLDHYVMSAMNEISSIDSEIETQSLESIVGDVSQYVSSVIGESSSSSKLSLSKPSITEKPSSFATENKKKYFNKKNTAASSSNSTSVTGHFLSIGPAEFAPLKRKVLNEQNRGTDESTQIKQNSTSNTKNQIFKLSDIVVADCSNANETSLTRNKRETEESFSQAQRRRRVRVRVPVNKKKTDESKYFNKAELLTVSEAQHTDVNIKDKNVEKSELEKYPQNLEFGSRRIKIIRGHKPAYFDEDNHEDDNEDEHYNENYQHRRRVVVTRRRRPEHILTEESNTDSFIPVTEPVVSEIPSLVDDILPITTYHPMEIPIFITSNMLDDTDIDILPTTVRGDNVGQTTIPRRRVVITKKRPIASTTPTSSSHRRRIVVTKRRPISKIDSDIEPTNAIPDSMSTLYSYKYTVLNRENGLNTNAEKMVKVSQVYMSGKIPEEDLRDFGSTQTVKDYEKGESEESHTSRKSDKNEEGTLTNDDITSKETSKKDDPAVISSIPELEMSTAEPDQIQPTQIESSFDVSSYDVGSETPLLSSGDAETVSLTDTDSATAVESSSVQNLEDAYKSSKKESHDNQEHKDESLDKHEEQDHHDEEVDDLHKHLEEDINDRSTESLSSQLHDSTPEGPRFIRPTRFSITRKPGNTKTGFPGRRRTSVGAPSASSSYTTSSNKYRSSYRGRKPSSPTSSTRTFGRSSKSSIHFFNTPTSSILEPTAVQEEEYVSPTILESSYSVEATSSDTLPSPIPETPELETLSQAFLPVISSTTVTEVITSTRLRTYTYIVTRVAGDDQVVTSTTSVKPRVTTLTVTKTLPILATEFRGNEEGRGLNMNIAGEARYNLATKVMSNGVEVIVAGDKSTLPGEPEVLRVLSSSLSRPITLAPSTLTDHMVLFLPSDSSQVEAQLSSSLQHNAFVTKTYLTTYTYLTTFLQDGTTAVSSHEKIVSNVVTEERSGTSMMTPTPTVGFTLSASPSLSTGVFHTTYTYLNTLVDGDVPLVVTSHRTVANTLTAPQDYLQQLQPSGESTLDTNTYLSTVAFTKTLTDGDDVKVVSTKDVLTQVVITESAKKPSDLKIPGSSPVPLQQSPQQGSITNIVKTYFVTYTYFSTFLEGGSTVIRSNIATSSDIVTEKFYVSPKRTMPPSFLSTPTPLVTPTSKIADKNSDFPLHLYATKTYLTTYTYFTTLLQDGGGDRTSTIVSSRTKIVQNVVTESVETSLLDPEYLESLRSSILADSTSSSSIVATATLSGGQQLKVTAMDHVIQPSSTKESEVTPTANHHELSSSMEETSNNLNNIITGSTIIFFDEDDQIDSSTSSRTLAIEVAGHTKATPSLSSFIPNSQIQSTLVNTGAATVLFPQDVVGAQPLVSSSPGAEPVPEPDNSFPIGLPSSLPLPFTFSPVAILTSILATSTITPNGATLQPGDQVIMMTEAGGNVTMIPVSDPSIKKPNGGFGPGGSEIQVSDLLSLGSLGINGLNALGPVINAMAGLIQNNLNQDKRRNDTTVIILPSTTPKQRPSPVYIPQNQGKPQDEGTTVRSPIYIPVGAVAGDTEDVDTAESQQYEGIVNLNGEVQWPTQGYPDTSQRRPSADPALNRPIEGALLGDGIPISPGQVITANSDVIVGKPAIMGPRPPKINNNKDEVPLGMKPPPLPPPPVWPNREVLPGHLPVREHGPGHVSLNKPFPPPPQSPNRNQHVPMRDHIPVHPPHRQHGHHPQVHHHSHSEGLPLLPPPMPKPEVGAHIIVDNENHIPAKVSPGSGLQTVFLGKPVPPGNDIIHGNPAPVPNTLDRSSGTPLLVNIQPSQVANVIIPSSTAPHIFNEHGAEFYDPSPYPLPESSPGFVGIDDNNHHNIPVHVGHQKPHVNQVSGTRMDFPPHEAVTIDHGNEGINVEISPGQGINVDVNPIHGINVDVSPGQGINVDVSPGQGLNVEISPGHFSQHGIKHEGERISPSGIVLDVPLQAGPGNEVLIGPPIRPVHNAHDHHRPSPPSLTGQVPPPPPPHKIPSNKHVQTSTPQNHKFLHPPRPTDFMVPPPPPVIHHSQDSFHNSGNHGPIIPLNPNGPHHPGPKTEDLLIHLDDKDEPLEVEGGEVIEESNQRPVRPGQIPVEVQLANSASTHRPVVVRPPQKNHGSMSHDEGLHQMKPPHSMFDKPLLPDAPIKPHPDIRPHKPNHEGRPHRPKPQTTVPKRPQASHNSETHSHERPLFEIPGDSKPEIIIESRPHVTNNNRHNMKNKPSVHIDEISNKPQHHNHRPENKPANGFGHQPQPGNKPIEVKVDRPHQSIFDKQDDIYKSTPDSRFDLETQANTPRPFSVLPAPQNGPTFDFNSDEIVVGMSPPPPRVTPVSNNGQRFPVLGIEPQVSTHRPIVNIGGQRRPPNRNKPRPQPPYKFELPETTVTTTEAPTTAQKTSTSRPFWIRPALHEISSPVSSSKPVRNEDENFIKKPSSSQDAIHSHRRPITTWRPPLAPDRPRPVKPLVTHPAESENKHTHNGETSISLDKIVPGSVKPAQSQPTAVLQTVVVGKPIPQEPVISPTTVKESNKKKQPATAFAGHDIIVGSEKPIIEESIISQATPSVSVYRRKSSVPSIASTIVSTGSKTIYGNLFTKPTPSSTVSSKPTAYKPISSFSGVHHKDNKDNQSSNLDNEDEDDLEFDDKVNHKTDLGVASSNEDKIIYSHVEVPTRYFTHTHTHTVTFTETTVISSRGHQPSTRTVIVTKTQTSTLVDTVTETKIHTLVQPTSVTATVTTTVSATPSVYSPGVLFDTNNYPSSPKKPLPSSPVQEGVEKVRIEESHSVSTSVETHVSHGEKNSFESGKENDTNNKGVSVHAQPGENESFFVIVNDQKPATINVNKGSSNDGDYNDKEDEIANSDESDPNSDVNHAVLLGGVLIAAPPRHNTPATHPSDGEQGGSTCRPDCSAARNELCQRVEGRMRCVCRPGFARMFPDRPCKPTYTYTMKLGLARHGKETLRYDDALSDSASPHYRQLAEAAREGLDRMVMQSDLRDIYHGVIVNGFQPTEREAGVTVNFHVQLSDNIDESRLQDVFRKSLRTTNFSLGGTEMFAHREMLHNIKADDFDECSSSQFHDCSEHAQCFNLRGTYTCSCQDGYTDLSENPLFPGRLCSADLIGCEKCHYHGTCYSRGDDQVMCECFQWYAGDNCQINLKVLLIALVTIGAVLLGLLIVCVVLTCLKRSSQRVHGSGTGFLRYRSPTHTLDKRAMIQDSSSEGSVADHGPISYLTPTHQPASTYGSQMKPALVHASGRKVSGTVELSDENIYSDQRDRSLTVMIPRAKYRPIPPTSPLLAMSTFGVEQKRAIAQEQQKLLSYLETGNKQESRPSGNARRKQSNSTNHTTDTAPPPSRKSSAPRKPSTGALVSAGFEVSATVGRKELDSDTDGASAAIVHSGGGGDGANINNNTLASSGSHFTTMRTNDSEIIVDIEPVPESTTDSQQDTNSRVQELTVSEARSFDETTVQPPTKSLHSNYGSNPSSRKTNDEAHTMAERDLGSTLLMPQTHLYKPDRGSDISNFDSL